MAIAKLTRSLYRASLRAAGRLDAMGPESRCAHGKNVRIEVEHGTPCSERHVRTIRSDMDSVAYPSFRVTVQQAYRGKLTHSLGPCSLDAGLALLSELNRAATLLDTSGDGSPRAHAAPFVAYRVGEVVHVPSAIAGAEASRRGVVIGWDPVSQSANHSGLLPTVRAQPHYFVLLDSSREMLATAVAAVEAQAIQQEQDKPSRVHDSRQAAGMRKAEVSGETDEPLSSASLKFAPDVAYIAQESLRPVTGNPASNLILHPLLGRYFRSFDITTGVYEMTSKQEALYPVDSYAALPLSVRVARKLKARSLGTVSGSRFV